MKRGLFFALFLIFVLVFSFSRPTSSQSFSSCRLQSQTSAIIGNQLPKTIDATFDFGQVKMDINPNGGPLIYQEPLSASGSHLPPIYYTGIFNDAYKTEFCKYYQFSTGGKYYGVTFESDSCADVIVTVDNNGAGTTFAAISDDNGRAEQFVQACNDRAGGSPLVTPDTSLNTTQNDIDWSQTPRIYNPDYQTCDEIYASSNNCADLDKDNCLFGDRVYCCDWDTTNQVTETTAPPAKQGCTSPAQPETTTKYQSVCKPKPEPLIPLW